MTPEETQGPEAGAGRFEEREPGAPTSVVYRVERVLEHRRGRGHEVLLFESPGLGKVLALDGIVQLTEADAYVYHEVLAHPALFAHPAPHRVAIVGGGDGHLAHEVLKHRAVERVWVLEANPDVVEVARAHFLSARQAYADPRVQLRHGDAFDLILELGEPADLVLCDLTDPIGEAARLFEEPFYERCRRAMAEDGILVAQTESLHFHPDTVRRCLAAVGRLFPHAALLWGAVATYPGAWWTFTVGSRRHDPRVARRRPRVETRLYHPRAHRWFFVPDPVLRGVLGPGG